MASPQLKTIEIPLDKGIDTYSDPFTLGPGLSYIKDGLWKPYGASVGFSKSLAPGPDFSGLGVAGTNLVGSYGFAPSVVINPAGGSSNILILGKHTDATFRAWRASNGASLTGPTWAASTQPNLPAVYAFWPELYQGTNSISSMYFAKTGMSKIYRCTSSLGVVAAEEWTVGQTRLTGPPAGTIGPMIVHMNRLYFSSIIGPTRSLLFFTDVLDPSNVRAGNFINVPGEIRALSKVPSTGGGERSMIIATRSQIFILDGDPTQGNSDFREISNTIGTKSQGTILDTPEGCLIFGSNNQLYLIPNDAVQLFPIGDKLKNVIEKSSTDPDIDYPSLTMGYLYPYVYIFPATSTGAYILDLRDFTFWGPKVFSTDLSVLGTLRGTDMAFVNTGLVIGSTTNGNGAFKIALGEQAGQIRLQTGFIQEPGMDVEFKEILLFAYTPTSATTFDVDVIDNEGNIITSLTALTKVKTIASTNIGRSYTTTIKGPRAAAFRLDIKGQSGVIQSLSKVLVSYTVHDKVI